MSVAAALERLAFQTTNDRAVKRPARSFLLRLERPTFQATADTCPGRRLERQAFQRRVGRSGSRYAEHGR